MSETKEPWRVQRHLKKIFESIKELEFTPDNKIHAMFSEEKEKIPFVFVIDPNNKQVEYWMGEVEDMMKRSVRQQLKDSIEEYPKVDRTAWVKNWPGQCVLNGSQVH